MDLPVNTFKRAILAGKRQVGLWCALGSPVTTELCAVAGFDWILIDGEHGANDVLSILPQLQAAAAYSSHAIVRPPTGDSVTIKRYLDIGAQTLLIPMVDTPEQAQALVDATRYAPNGIRGMATMTRAARWARVPNYIGRAREEICLIPQIETATAMDNIGKIAAIDGIDAVFIGPTDLSASMGYPGQASHPEVVAAVEKGIRTILDAGKPAGIFTSEEMAVHYMDKGCTFAAVGADVLLLAKAVDALRSRFPA